MLYKNDEFFNWIIKVCIIITYTTFTIYILYYIRIYYNTFIKFHFKIWIYIFISVRINSLHHWVISIEPSSSPVPWTWPQFFFHFGFTDHNLYDKLIIRNLNKCYAIVELLEKKQDNPLICRSTFIYIWRGDKRNVVNIYLHI